MLCGQQFLKESPKFFSSEANKPLKFWGLQLEWLTGGHFLLLYFGAFCFFLKKLDLSEDVAGATFMAAGSSAPELFASVIGRKYTHTDTHTEGEI